MQSKKSLYVTADHPYFYKSSLFDLATLFYAYSGELLVIDEVHKYSNWSRELKLIYDGFPNLKVIFTSSSALDLYRGRIRSKSEKAVLKPLKVYQMKPSGTVFLNSTGLILLLSPCRRTRKFTFVRESVINQLPAFPRPI
ncbi:MAG: AAA family ATPase [Arcicella sp.]|nr:AAA family ATPase [Arcicella sp.]